MFRRPPPPAIPPLFLRQDPYGNYVVQYILGICSREEAAILVEVPIGKVKYKSAVHPSYTRINNSPGHHGKGAILHKNEKKKVL